MFFKITEKNTSKGEVFFDAGSTSQIFHGVWMPRFVRIRDRSFMLTGEKMSDAKIKETVFKLLVKEFKLEAKPEIENEVLVNAGFYDIKVGKASVKGCVDLKVDAPFYGKTVHKTGLYINTRGDMYAYPAPDYEKAGENDKHMVHPHIRNSRGDKVDICIDHKVRVVIQALANGGDLSNALMILKNSLLAINPLDPYHYYGMIRCDLCKPNGNHYWLYSKDAHTCSECSRMVCDDHFVEDLSACTTCAPKIRQSIVTITYPDETSERILVRSMTYLDLVLDTDMYGLKVKGVDDVKAGDFIQNEDFIILIQDKEEVS